MKRYYIKWSDFYILADIKSGLKLAWANNIRECNQYGWSNQPKVATFAIKDERMHNAVMKRIDTILPLATVCEQDW